MQTAIPCSVMRGGTSKGLYFRSEHLPADRELRDEVLIAAMGSPDLRQIDGMGGAHPLTSKVAVVSGSDRADVDYLFLQVMVDRAQVSDSQNCGNILAGVAPFAIDEVESPARRQQRTTAGTGDIQELEQHRRGSSGHPVDRRITRVVHPSPRGAYRRHGDTAGIHHPEAHVRRARPC